MEVVQLCSITLHNTTSDAQGLAHPPGTEVARLATCALYMLIVCQKLCQWQTAVESTGTANVCVEERANILEFIFDARAGIGV